MANEGSDDLALFTKAFVAARDVEMTVETTVTAKMIDAGVVAFWTGDHGAMIGPEVRDLVAAIYRAMHGARR